MPEETLAAPEHDQSPDAGLLDDEFDLNEAKRLEQLDRNSAAVRRAHAIDQSDDDLLPSF